MNAIAAAARAAYRRALAGVGETVTVARGTITAPVLARLRFLMAEELAGGVNRRERKVILLAEDLEKVDFPLPLQPNAGDEVRFADGTVLVITDVDNATRRVAGTVIAYEVMAG